MSSTIDNQGTNTMANALRAFLPASDKMDILVGYFYFSGFQEIYKELQDKKMRILVGIDIDERLIPTLARKSPQSLYDLRASSPLPSLIEEEDRYFSTLAGIFNDTNWFESTEAIEAFKVFVSKIEDGSLEIKKSIEPRHDKLFIFHYKTENTKNGYQPGSVITGSSNLSFSGLVSRSERNKIHEDKENFMTDSEYFEECWNNSENITIVDLKTKDKFIKQIHDKLWLYQKPSPYHLYIRILKEIFSINVKESDVQGPKEATGGKFSNFRYQLDAIAFGIDRIIKYNGVIIADVVGLGKSIIASGIAHNLKKKTIIVCPPHLVEQWTGYKTEFHINATVFTSGKLEEALKHKEQYGKEWLIIIDEAHKFRNEDTENYKLLHKLCANTQVLLLSATPFNNDPKDLFALVKLFDTPGLSKIQTVENLSTEFRLLFTLYKSLRKKLRKDDPNIDLIKQKGEEIARKLRQLVSPVLLRRSRSDLQNIEIYKKDLESQNISFATVHDPILKTYSLGEISDRYIQTLEYLSPNTNDEDNEESDDFSDVQSTTETDVIAGLIGARYKTISYLSEESETFKKFQEEELIDEEILEEKDKKVSAKKTQQQIGQAQINVAKFMRRLLVRRFESSLPAFRSTLENILNQSKNMRNMITKQGIVIVMKKGEIKTEEELADMIEGEREDYFKMIEEKGALRIPANEFRLSANASGRGLLEDLNRDISLLEEIWEWWFGQDAVQSDPKFDCLKELLDENLRTNHKRKVIIFSEFADTAQSVYEGLLGTGLRIMKYSSIDAGSEKKEEIRLNFDAGVPTEDQKDDYDILIATDAISEGYNLHRAGVIINYDIPFNPTRVIQRIGRINRVNKKVFDDLYIYNFFPTAIGEKETQTKGISTLKMHMIHALLGDDAKTLTSEEELQSYFTEEYKKAEAQSEGLNEWGWQKEYRNDWEAIKNDIETMKIVDNIAHRVRIGRVGVSVYQTISFARRGDTPLFGAVKTGEAPELLGPEIVLPFFRAQANEESYEVTDTFEGLYSSLREKLFQNNTDKTYEGRRKQALERIDVLRIKIPELDTYFRDIKKLIQYDALPEGVYKDISQISGKIEDAKIGLESAMPRNYVAEKIHSIEENQPNDQIIYLSEQFLG